jgi:hypothetical protein
MLDALTDFDCVRDIPSTRSIPVIRSLGMGGWCRMDLPGPTALVGTRTDYSVGPLDYPTCAARHLMA